MKKDVYELTSPQNNIWLIEQFYEDTAINNIVGYLKFNMKIDVQIIKNAANLFVKENDSLRSKFTMQQENVVQYIEDYSSFDINVIQCNDNEAKNIKEIFATKPFEILNHFLYDTLIIEFPDNTCGLLFKLHHLISDAWTMSLCLSQILDNCSYLIKNNCEDRENKPSYISYINAEKEYFSSNKFEKDKEYWENYFSNLPDEFSLKKNEQCSFNADRKICVINSNLADKINNFCLDNKISSYIFFLATFTIYFRSIYNSKNYIIGNPILNRSNFNEKKTTGLFVTTQPFMVNINDSITFLEHCSLLSKDQMNMYRHLKYPYSSILSHIRKEKPNVSSLYDIIFSYQNAKVNIVNNDIDFASEWIFSKEQMQSLMVHIKDTDNTRKYIY